ncbi:MAG: hypothetical protein GY790_10675 [Bacteroidetes bacterium]|nr:hypothetical protein [Bacteroidota bacterium]
MIYRVQRMILLVFYTISMAALSIPVIRLVTRLSPDNLYPLLVVLLLYMVFVIVLGSLIHTISYIPFNLAAAFDPIKNDVASGGIRDMKELGRRITGFVTEFFNFAFLDIKHAFLHTDVSGPVSCEELPEAVRAMEEFGMLEKSKSMKDIIRAGKITIGQHEYHLYILPIWLGDQWLGYMGLLSKNRIGRFYQEFLTEFENNFLDDQLMYVIRMKE